jgi:hypothetical protein
LVVLLEENLFGYAHVLFLICFGRKWLEWGGERDRLLSFGAGVELFVEESSAF